MSGVIDHCHAIALLTMSYLRRDFRLFLCGFDAKQVYRGLAPPPTRTPWSGLEFPSHNRKVGIASQTSGILKGAAADE